MVVVQTLVSILICVVPMLVTPKPAIHHVNIENMQFQPDVVSVERGDSIVWMNKDLFHHTVTSKSGDFDSHEMKPGETWTYRAAKAGEADYVCSLHPTMHAVLRVK